MRFYSRVAGQDGLCRSQLHNIINAAALPTACPPMTSNGVRAPWLQPLRTVFFGGGTPSLMPPALVQQLLAALHGKFGIAPDAEVSMEADPGEWTADPEFSCFRLRLQSQKLLAALWPESSASRLTQRAPWKAGEHTSSRLQRQHAENALMQWRMPPAAFARAFTDFRRCLAFTGTFDAGRLRDYMALGLTRFSVGVQVRCKAVL